MLGHRGEVVWGELGDGVLLFLGTVFLHLSLPRRPRRRSSHPPFPFLFHLFHLFKRRRHLTTPHGNPISHSNPFFHFSGSIQSQFINLLLHVQSLPIVATVVVACRYTIMGADGGCGM